ncbi:hypothetical protein [Bacillus sp. FJAT-22090]|uniref:hypothetical protein n=1 Tax=Bacillus sp. FJAT-22090 TaxID=1581038 RepID=UPI00119EB3EB|nr:hypothetical protein [Bacillus sp. FJAT-22090]
MWSVMQEKQAVLKQEINKRDKKIRKQQQLGRQLESALQKKQGYIKELKKEQKDVDNLDRFSILNTIRTWTGKQDEIREKELSELAAVEAKLRETEKMIVDIQQDMHNNEIDLQRAEWQSLDSDWEHLIKEKEQWIYRNSEVEAERLEKLYEEKTKVITCIREVEEALLEGKRAKAALKRALELLDSAKGYSTWDTFFGGGIIATAVKHSRLDESENAIHDAQLALQRFQTELLDVQQMKVENLVVERDSFVTFADYVFDDIFSAWSTHSKIQTSIERIENTISELGEVSRNLTAIQHDSEVKQQEVENAIQGIIEG